MNTCEPRPRQEPRVDQENPGCSCGGVVQTVVGPSPCPCQQHYPRENALSANRDLTHSAGTYSAGVLSPSRFADSVFVTALTVRAGTGSEPVVAAGSELAPGHL